MKLLRVLQSAAVKSVSTILSWTVYNLLVPLETIQRTFVANIGISGQLNPNIMI